MRTFKTSKGYRIESLKQWADDIEGKLGLPAGFLFQLRDEKDWAFVIQSHALLETLMTELLVETLGREELRPFVVTLNASNDKTGKIGLLLALGLVNRQDRNLFRVLSEIRNSFAHSVSRIGVALSTYVAEPPKERLDKLVQATPDFLGVTRVRKKDAPGGVELILRREPKTILWTCVALMATGLSVHHDVAKIERTRKTQGPQFGDALLEVLAKAEAS